MAARACSRSIWGTTPATKQARKEVQAAKAQHRLARKDARILKSMELAAQSKMGAARTEDEQFLAARNKHLMLDERLAQLSQRFDAQMQALEYMVPNTERQAFGTQKLALGVKELKQSLGKLTKDIEMVEQAVSKTKDEVKPVKEELKTSDEILTKSANAYRLFGERVAQARQKAGLAREQVEQLDQGAMLAQEYATRARAEALHVSDKKKAQLMAQAASEADAKVDMLKKQSAEAMQSAQLFDAEADEAASYMSMFGADAQQAHLRQGMAAQKLNHLAAEYEKGQQLEAMALQKKMLLQQQLVRSGAELKDNIFKTREEEMAVAKGERATARTGKALHIDRDADAADARGAVGDIAAMRKDEGLYLEDASQARDVAEETLAHKEAAQHLLEAAEASRDEAHDQAELSQDA